MTRTFAEVKELEQITDTALGAIKNLNRGPRDLANALNKSIRGRIARGATPEAKIVADALKKAGFDPRTLTAVRQEVAAVEEGTAVAKALPVVTRVAKAVAPVAKALKPLAPAIKVLGRAAGVAGVALSVVDLATAKTTDQRVDAGIGLAGNALLASENPVAIAAGAGVLGGQYLEHKLNVSDVSSSWGTSAYEGLKKVGVGDTTSFVVGGVVTVASTPAALAVAAYKKAVSLW